MDNSYRDNICIRLSKQSDNEGLIRLTAVSAMQGKISFRTDRRPDFFRLPASRGNSTTIIAESEDKIIGSATFSCMSVYIGHQENKAFYLCDFKVDPAHRKKGITLKLIQALLEKLRELQADVVFGTSIAGNKAIEKFFTGSDQWPAASHAGKFLVYQLVPRKFSIQSRKYQIKENTADNQHIALLNEYLLQYEIAPELSVKMLEDSVILDAFHQNERVASLCLCDAGYMKQETLTGLPPALRILSRCLFFIGKIFSAFRMPVLNNEMKILHIRAFAFKPGHEEALQLLIRSALTKARKDDYHFLTIGIHEKNPLKKLFSGYLHFTLHSNLYVGSLKNNQSAIEPILKGIPFFDYSRV
jgi:predicted N-acetyltransferase YhbS